LGISTSKMGLRNIWLGLSKKIMEVQTRGFGGKQNQFIRASWRQLSSEKDSVTELAIFKFQLNFIEMEEEPKYIMVKIEVSKLWTDGIKRETHD